MIDTKSPLVNLDFAEVEKRIEAFFPAHEATVSGRFSATGRIPTGPEPQTLKTDSD